ncbi:DUF4240 domain-containing protein [Nonomuraea sp. NPDC050663]|uniref:DUF4240 domain-containing protein n=1 Tax=Nonomuraea sp. NPDC050663 TaxID=3364370 RepID=UPI0037B5708B
MDIHGFWALIERSATVTDTRADRVAWLTDQLADKPVDEIADYLALWDVTRDRAWEWDLYAAYWAVMGSGSLDGFEYFVAWLIGLGRDPYELVVECPDRLIELPAMTRMLAFRRTRPEDLWSYEDYPEFEVLGYVAFDAYERATGDAEGLSEAVRARRAERRRPARGTGLRGDEWNLHDFDEHALRLPLIARWLETG